MLSLIQGYRGIAALLVVLYHASAAARAYFGDAPALHAFDFGWAGVQFFFVLSGFIICHVHREDIGRPGRAFPYLRKRIRRIYPLYILITLALVPVWLAVPGFGAPYHRELDALILSLLLIPQPHVPHLAVAWTLIHEMLFYLLFAVLILNRSTGRIVFAVWFAAIIIIPSGGYPFTVLLSINNLLFGLGLLAALCPWRPGWILFALGNALFIVTGVMVNDGLTGNSAILAFGLASFCIILSARRLDAAFRYRTLLLLGDASYAIYLVHYPVISAICKLLSFWAVPSVLAMSLAALIAIAGGIGVHLVLEKPLLAWRTPRHHSAA